LPWRFGKTPKNYWENVNNVKKFITWASKQLNIKEMNDWYNISVTVKKKFSHS
jgi:hypothetical protein